MKPLAALAALLVLAGCDAPRPPEDGGGAGVAAPPPPQSAPPFAAAAGSNQPASPASADPNASADWTRQATPADRERLARLPAAWTEALAEARGKNAKEVAALGALADPDAALPRPHPAPGVYRCRTIKLGSMGEPTPHSLAYVAYPHFRCRVELTPGGDLTLAKQTGSQRGTGQFFPERDAQGADTARLIFLGAQAWGSDEASAPGYGREPDRDQIGVLERIGPDRYRLALPWPRQESKLDLLELERVGN